MTVKVVRRPGGRTGLGVQCQSVAGVLRRNALARIPCTPECRCRGDICLLDRSDPGGISQLTAPGAMPPCGPGPSVAVAFRPPAPCCEHCRALERCASPRGGRWTCRRVRHQAARRSRGERGRDRASRRSWTQQRGRSISSSRSTVRVPTRELSLRRGETAAARRGAARGVSRCRDHDQCASSWAMGRAGEVAPAVVDAVRARAHLCVRADRTAEWFPGNESHVAGVGRLAAPPCRVGRKAMLRRRRHRCVRNRRPRGCGCPDCVATRHSHLVVGRSRRRGIRMPRRHAPVPDRARRNPCRGRRGHVAGDAITARYRGVR